MIQFLDNQMCKSCALSEWAASPGIPTRQYAGDGSKSRALLCVGESPGIQEDRAGECWVGPSGTLLQTWLTSSGLPDHVDIFLANAFRCRMPHEDSAKMSYIKPCRLHLYRDILALLKFYSEVFILCLGATATRSLLNLKLGNALEIQGRRCSLQPPSKEHLKEDWWLAFQKLTFPIFATYHPANLLPGRSPSNIHAVADHFDLLVSTITGERNLPPTTDLPSHASPPPHPLPSLVSLDIETYGILGEQTVFHPVKSRYVDKVPYSQQVVTVALSWETGDGGLSSTIFLWQDPADRKLLFKWLFLLRRAGSTITGKNICFDLSYLRRCDSLFKSVLCPPLHLDDIAIWNYLDYELRPEKSLKPLAQLLNIADYTTLAVNARAQTHATSPSDPNLWRYNATDSEAVSKLHKWFTDSITKRYGHSSTKLSPTCTEHRSLLLWTTLDLIETGITFDHQALQAYHTTLSTQLEELSHQALTQHGVILSGAGSDKSKREFVLNHLGDLIHNPGIQFTDKRKDISLKQDNLTYIKTLSDHPVLDLMVSQSELYKTYSSFTKPLLTNRHKGCAYVRRNLAYAYPSWYPVPYSRSGSTSKEQGGGGTIQGRITCSKPGAQTFPPPIKKLLCSRFPGGHLLWVDMAQIELRVAALVSGDPVMLHIYETDSDLHTETALNFFGGFPTHPDFSRRRYIGKTINFAKMYRAGPTKIQYIMASDPFAPLNVPLGEVQLYSDKFDARYHILRAWQDSLISLAARQGYLELPTGWGRTFSGGRSVIEATYVNEICNFPIQTLAAQLLQSAHFAILRDPLRSGFLTRIPLQTYDALLFDVPPNGELPVIRHIIHKHLTRPPLLSILESYYHRTVPLKYSLEVS